MLWEVTNLYGIVHVKLGPFTLQNYRSERLTSTSMQFFRYIVKISEKSVRTVVSVKSDISYRSFTTTLREHKLSKGISCGVKNLTSNDLELFRAIGRQKMPYI